MNRSAIFPLVLLFGFAAVKVVPAADASFCSKWHPGHYVLLTRHYDVHQLESFLARMDNTIKGVQVVLPWRELESEKNRYTFGRIETLLNVLGKFDKHLFLQVTERSFKANTRPVPEYLLLDSRYGGGMEPFREDMHQGTVARVWDPEVGKRFNRLVTELGSRFDTHPAFEGINFPETAIGIDAKKAKGFSKEVYIAALKQRLETAKNAFPRSVVIQYVNYGGTREELESFIRYCNDIGVGIGGPDLVPDRGRHPDKKRIPAYDFYPVFAGKMPLGVAVQTPNFTGKKGRFTLDDFWDMGLNTLKLNYIFWSDVEGRRFTHRFSRDIYPYIQNKFGNINTACPENRRPCCPAR